MLVIEVLKKYHQRVPLPWTIRKIKKAGFNVTDFIMGFCEEMQDCKDCKSPEAKAALKILTDLGMFI